MSRVFGMGFPAVAKRRVYSGFPGGAAYNAALYSFFFPLMKSPLKGFLLSLVTVVMWGALPLIMQQVLTVMAPQTVVASRFFVAALILGVFLQRRHRLPAWRALSQPRYRRLLLVGVAGLVGNFWLFSSALLYLPAAASQVLAQLSPFFLLFAGVFFLKESLGRNQQIGAVILFGGILLFFNRELPALFNGGLGGTSLGILLSVAACLVWTCYGLAQKILLRDFSAQQILFVLYCGCALVSAPFAHWGELRLLDGYQWLCLLFCCLNTPIAYGAFAEALNHWEVSKVSTTITLVPLFTIAFAALGHRLQPQRFAAADVNLLAAVGAALVVAGAICSALQRRQKT